MDIIKTKDVKDGVTITEPVDTFMIDLLKTETLEGKFITFRYIDRENDEVEMVAYSDNPEPLKRFMIELHDESLCITNIPKRTGVFYLGGM